MSLFATLYTGASGMLAHSQATAATSENIANASTVGYKRMESKFHEVVSAQSKETLSTAQSRTSGVSWSRVNRIDDQGSILQSSSATDMSVIGNGFFTVGRDANAGVGDFLYTRNGTFAKNSQGFLENSAGFLLYGVPTNSSGTPSSDITSAGSYQPINIDIFQTANTPTSEALWRLNLDSQSDLIDPHALAVPQSLPISNAPSTFTRTLNVYDSTGVKRDLIFEFRRTIGPMAHFRSDFNVPDLALTSELVDNPLGPTPSLTVGDSLQISTGGNNYTVDFVAAPADPAAGEARSLDDLINAINNFEDGGGNKVFRARFDKGELLVQALDPTADLDISGNAAGILGAGGFDFITDPADGDYIYSPEADLNADGLANPNQSDFPAFTNTTSPNPYNWWEMRVLTIDPTDPSGSNRVEIRKGLINFNGDGSLNMNVDANGQSILDLSGLDFDTAQSGEELDISFDMVQFTQFATDSSVTFTSQNGTPIGSRTDVKIDNQGIVYALFDNGIEQPIYRIGLADFANVNGLERVSGTAFAVSDQSGLPSYAAADSNGMGFIQASSLENANVDIANEFGNLIVSQRAYSLSSQIITAANEMAQTLTRLK